MGRQLRRTCTCVTQHSASTLYQAVAFLLILILWPAHSYAQTLPDLERLMREVQARHKFVSPGSNFIIWDEGGCSQAPPYPPDGFYESCVNPSGTPIEAVARALTNDVVGAFRTKVLTPDVFLTTSWLNALESGTSSAPQTYDSAAFSAVQSVSGSASIAECNAMLELLSEALTEITHLHIDPSKIAADREVRNATAHNSDCAADRAELEDELNEDFPGVTQVTDNASLETMMYLNGNGSRSASAIYIKGKYQCELSGRNGNLQVWLRASNATDGPGGDPPVPTDGDWQKFKTSTASGVDQTVDVTDQADPLLYELVEYCGSGDHPHGWKVLDAVGVLECDFRRTPDYTVPGLTGTISPPISTTAPGSQSEGNFVSTCPTGDAIGSGPARLSYPLTKNPVSVATGTKIERAVDAVVPWSGPAISIDREYTSETAYLSASGGNLVGKGWTLGVARAMHAQDVGGGAIELTMHGPPLHTKLLFTKPGGSSYWTAGGPATQKLYKTTRTIDGTAWPVWQLKEDGQWSMEFVRQPDQGEYAPDSKLYDLLLYEEDVYQNSRVYVYSTSASNARLAAILLNGTPVSGTSEADIVFTWSDTSGDTKGKLKKVEVRRRIDATNQYKTTQKVEYTYYAEGSGWSWNLGSGAALVQVRAMELVDQAEGGSSGVDQFRRWITQYRYHDGYSPSSSDERLTAKGAAGQIKSVIKPEQIEYYAQKRNNWSAATALESAAAELLTIDDGGSLGSPLQANILVDLASKIISFNLTTTKVEKQFLQTACGCAGSSQGIKEVYDYYSYTGGLSTKMREFLSTGTGTYSSTAYRTAYHDMVNYGTPSIPYLQNEVVAESSTRYWVTRHEYDSTTRNETRIATPSATLSYTPSSGSAPSHSYKSGSGSEVGLVTAIAYDSNNRPMEWRVGKTNHSSFSSFDQQRKVTYSGTKPWLPITIELFNDPTSTSAELVQTTSLEYGFHDGDRIAFVRTIEEAELVGENGPDGTGNTYDRYELFDKQGHNVWSRAQDKSLVYRAFDQTTNALTQVTENASKTAPNGDAEKALVGADFAGVNVSDWGTSSDGGELTTTNNVDLLGRVRQVTEPGGVAHYIIRQMWSSPDWAGVHYYREVGLPFKLAGSPVTFDGPAEFTWLNALGKQVSGAAYEVDGTQTYNPSEFTFTLGAQLARSSSELHISGLVKNEKEWPRVADSNSYHTRSFEYDALGRVSQTTNYDGTITKNAVHDVLDRVQEVHVGTASSTPLKVAEYFYDFIGSGTPQHTGIGNGNITVARTYTGEDGTIGANERVVKQTFDWRDRLIIVENPVAPHATYAYDNLNRRHKEGLFVVVSSDVDSNTNRVRYVKHFFSQRGLPHNDSAAIDAGASTLEYFETNRWFDKVGRVLAVWSPGSPGLKEQFDGLGRSKARYATDRSGEVKPGTSGNYSAATTLTAQKVREQRQLRYNNAGLVDLETRLHASHDYASTGVLSSSSAIATYIGRYYDAANRPIRTVEFGTNTSNDQFEIGGSAPTWPPGQVPNYNESPYNTDAYIVTARSYNSRGLVDTETDSLGRVTKSFYDDMGRAVGIAENYVNATLTWGSGRWDAGNLGPAADVDRVTSTVLSGEGKILKRVVHFFDDPKPNDEGVQVTQYVYGTTVPGSPGLDDSLIASNDLLFKVHFPNRSTGEADTSVDYTVICAYNRQGELRAVRDQNDTKRSYHRDLLGRVTADRIRNFGTGIDTTIKRINTEYDSAGRLLRVTSFPDVDAADPAKNAVEFAYNSVWQPVKVYQNVSGPVAYDGSGNPTGATRVVIYDYDKQKVATTGTADGNFSRRITMSYPESTNETLTYAYGSSGGLNDRFSRIQSMSLEGFNLDDLLNYEYVGSDMVSRVDYDGADVQLDRTLDPVGSYPGTRRWPGSDGPEGVYPGWDRFGRVKTQAWVDGEHHAHSTDHTVPNTPQIVYIKQAFDRASNVLSRTDVRTKSLWANKDTANTYDGLDRVIQADRGKAGGTWTLGLYGQKWTLDALGNWDEVFTELNGTSGFSTPSEQEVREKNQANEMLSRDPAATGTGPVLALTYDLAGNVLTAQRSATTTDTYVHDAWGRLVRQYYGSGGGVSVIECEYNGLNWRTVRRAPNPTMQQNHRAFYYSAEWQLLEERIDIGYSSGTPTVDHVAQLVWGTRYLDDAVFRRIDKNLDLDFADSGEGNWYYLTDAQFSSVAVVGVGDAPALHERVHYAPYGEATHRLPGDVNNDGFADLTDVGLVNGLIGIDIDDSTYNVAMDVDRDGSITNTDKTIVQGWTSTSPPGAGKISYANGPDSPVGFCGYIFNPENLAYTVRNRWYEPVWGRWMERDPAGYSSGSNLYEYVGSRPSLTADPFGLEDPVAAARYRRVLAANPGFTTQQRRKVQALWYGNATGPERLRFDMQQTARHAAADVDRMMAEYRRQSARTIGETAGSMVPVVGEALDIDVILDPESAWWERAMAAGSLGANVATAGLLPNAGAFIRGAKRVAKGVEEAEQVCSGARSVVRSADELASGPRATGSSGPSFIVAPDGSVFPVPRGATGPHPTGAPGMQFTGGSGGHGLDPRVTGVRLMDANANQGARAVYMNKAGQTVNPLTGRTVPYSDPTAHFYFNPDLR